MVITHYELLDKLEDTPHTTIYKAYHKQYPDRPLILKILKTVSLPDFKQIQFAQKIEHLKVLDAPCVITPANVCMTGDVLFITQYYFNGVSLDKLGQARHGITLNAFFTIACALADTLTTVHETGIIHGGIKPHNILVNPATLEIRLIDFISTVNVRDVSHFIYDRSFVRETLAYTSPEQTGRINHRVDFSSDIYSLGIVFYELLTGYLPFKSDDPLEMIHSHLAQEAPDAHTVNPAIPEMLAKIIAKMMVKEPDRRYRNCSALLKDLIRCRDEYATGGTIRAFPLESHDYTHRTTFVSKMVGRDRESAIILSEYEQVAAGTFRALFISGLSGIGKTRLIQELQKPIIRHRGYFTSGKYDVYQKNIPYSSLIQAFRNLLRTFLTENDERVALWRERILNAVGRNGRVLTDVVPELETLIGAQPEVPPLPPVESLNRFHEVFDHFLTCLASKEHPLVMFIDDLQWCDMASFDFLADILANHQDHPHLFLLGAYRHNEVDSSHPLSRLIRTVLVQGNALKEIRLDPLQPEHCHEMVSHILGAPVEQTTSLSDFIGTLSEGNPLFISESLSYLHNESLLYRDEEKQWRWDMEKIRQSDMPATVVSLFGVKLRRLPPELIDLLEQCACLGNSFSPAELSDIRGMSLRDIYQLLKPALGLGLLLEHRNRLQFVHDKVQEAALAAIPAERKRAIHRQVGNHMLDAVPPEADPERLDNLFTIVSHLNLGREEAPANESAYALSAINYHAGNKALASLATGAANEYFSLSLSLLPDDCWHDDHYERTFRIFQKAAKTELMCGNYERSEQLLSCLLDHARSDLDKAECLAEQTTSLSSIGNFIRAIETANRGLAYFHKNIPECPHQADARRAELMAKIAGQGDVWQTILHMPFTTERQRKIELAFYSELIPDLYMSGLVPQLYLSAAQSTQLCLAGGMDESVIYSFSIMGLQLGEQGNFDQAFRYEDLARDLSAGYPNTFGATRGMNGIVWCNMHSRSHPRQIVEYALKAIQCGKNCGDLYNAGLSYGPLMWNLQIQGENLDLIEEYTRECLHFSRRYNLSFSVGLAEAMQAGWIAPMQNGYVAVAMDDKIRQWQQDNHVASAGSYHVHLALTRYYFGEYEQAQVSLDEVQKYLAGLTDNVLKRQWHVFRVLNALRLFSAAEQDSSAWDVLMTHLRPLIAQIETWAALGPLLKPYLALLYAELERSKGNFREARSLYLDAIDAAHTEQYVFLEGYLHECLGNLLSDGEYSSGAIYFTEAARLYRQCGAQRKELTLREQRPEYFSEQDKGYGRFESDFSTALPNLDVDYLMKSSLAISAEIVQDSLLDKIMNVVIESSGAQHGYLLMLDNGSLFVRAESHVAGSLAVQTTNQHLDDTEEICKSIVRYVQRTGERVILDNASREGMFKDNPEVQELCLRSVLCLPVIRQSIMTGVLYLENRLSEAVFTREKAQMTELLTSQAAISMENARLVDEMKKAEEALEQARDELEQRVAARTAELEEQSRILESFFKHTKTGFVFLDTNFNFIRVNEAYARSCQRRIDDFTGQNHFELYPSDEIKGRFQHVVETGEPFYAYERPFTFPDHPEWGTSYWDLAVAPILNAQQNIECLVFTLNDVTERKRVADELQDKNQLLLQQSRQAAMGEMINNIAHQWRQPLNTLGLFTQRLGLFYGSPRFNKEFLDMSVAKSMEIIRHMSKTIDDFRNYFKPDKEMNTFAVTDMIENALSLLEGSLQNPKITIEVDARDNPVINGFQNEFSQVILNILINARDALIENSVDDARVIITICSEDGCAVVTIADNAGGIPEQIVDKIFEPYFTTKGPDKGTGVGLFMSKAIIEKNMNGKLTVRNTSQGAEFRIEI